MTPIEIGLISVAAIVILIYLGVYIPIALGVVSFVSVWLMRDNFDLAMNLVKVAVSDSVGMGSDIYDVMNAAFRKISGGIGMATVGANAMFAAVTGSSIASASVFSTVAVPQMLRYDYNPRFAVGVVAGSSVLGMIIPPSAMLIIYSFVAEQSVGDMFKAGIVPGIMLAAAYIGAIAFAARFFGENLASGLSHYCCSWWYIQRLLHRC